MSTYCIIYKTKIKKLSNFKNLNKYTSHYQAAFNKVVGLLTEISSYIWQNMEIYFQATMLMNIKTNDLALISAI